MGAFRLAFVADEEVAYDHARWPKPELEPRADATQSFVAEVVDAAISAWVAEECNHVLGQELRGEEEKLHFAPEREAMERG